MPTSPCCAATPPTVCPASPGWARRPLPVCSTSTAISKLVAASDYLAVAPTVVEVVCDIDLPEFDDEIRPLTEEQLARVAVLGKKWGLGSPLTRVLAALDDAAGS
jgi:hypothetical protein